MRSLLLIPFALLLLTSPGIPAQGTQHRAMLATVYDGEIDVNDYWISEKLDGVRGHWDGQALWTRGGHTIQTPDWYTDSWPQMPMDGELWIARNRFDETSGIVRRTDPNDTEWRQVKFMIFDLPAHNGTFDQRVEAMGKLPNHGIPWLKPIHQFRVDTREALDEHLDAVVKAGGEGLMLHKADAFYRAGRSNDLLKYKPYEDAEARVIGYTGGKGKYNGQVGALVVETADGKRFRLGSGLSDAERADPPPIGSWVTYRYNGLTSNGLPRFARFVRIRLDAPDSAAARTTRKH